MKKLLIPAAVLAVAAAGAVVAGSHGGNPAVKARQAHMTLNSFHAGYLGAVMQGKADYDADTAQGAADALMALAGTGINQSRMWPQGTDADSIEGTRALPAAWADFPDMMEKLTALLAATTALAAVAGDGEDAMKTALGPVFGACGACHKAYRVPS